MPTPPRNRLCLRPLEDRALMSAGIVVSATDAHDVITLASQDGDRVTVTVRSYQDPEWTQPISELVREYDLRLDYGVLTPTWDEDNSVFIRRIVETTGTIQVDGGAGHDRIEIIDVVKGFYVSGTHRTEEGAVAQFPVLYGLEGSALDFVSVPLLEDEQGERWAMSHDMFTAEWSAAYTDSLTEGVDLDESAIVGIRFFDLPWTLPEPNEPGAEADSTADEAAEDEFTGQFPSAEGLDLLAGGDAEGWLATEWGPGPDGEAGAGWWSDDPGLTDLWVEWAGDLATHWIEGEADFGPDALVEEGLGEWLEISLETEAD